MTYLEVLALAESIAPQYGVEPKLVVAICEQESDYREDEARLEQGFYRKYTRPDKLATTTEILLAASYGLMQTMGQVLREDGYFDWFKEHHNRTATRPILNPLEDVAVTKAINFYMVRPPEQINRGCRIFKKKLERAKDDISKALLYYNGGGNKEYPSEVLARYERLRGGVKK